MPFEFRDLRHALQQWPDMETCVLGPEDGLYRRALQVLLDSRNERYLLHSLDFQVLIRNILSKQAFLDGAASIEVPKSDGWPSPADWATIGVRVIKEEANFLRIEAKKWQPTWLNSGDDDVLEEIYEARYCRPPMRVIADPCFEFATGYPSYTCSGQRAAIHSLFFMKPGSTLVVNLPTGSGKSLVGYLPALLGPAQGNITVFIVPTIALALDQARQFTKLRHVDYPTAWHSDLDDADQRTIKFNIRNGNQTILFASPEAICGSLRPALFDASKKGFITNFVVDEAHLVAQWGDEFRPDFQAVSGIRRGLFRTCPTEPFKTILMTATLTDDTLQTLETLFDSVHDFQVVSAVHLRPEPRYWTHKALDYEDKKRKVIEAIMHGPRPFILYVMRPDEAESWLHILKKVGLERIACFHGKTNNLDREKILKAWEEDLLDGIVATSAFGVGVDKRDVRMVIHACAPETLDRFYQEVGRGGRDGRPSLSLTVFTERDIGIASRMGQPAIISDELGRGRWDALSSNCEVAKGVEDLFVLDLSVVPSNLEQQSDYNRAWNLRTIILLARAGVICLDADPPPYDDNPVSESDDYFDKVPVRILNPRHCDDDVWSGVIEETRRRSIESGQRSYSLLTEVLNGKVEMGEAFTKLYTIDRNNSHIPVTTVCGGCSICRKLSIRDQDFRPPVAIPVHNIAPINIEFWETTFSGLTDFSVITYPVETQKRLRPKILATLSELVSLYGIREISVLKEANWLEEDEFKRLYERSANHFLVHTLVDDVEGANLGLQLPRVTILYPWTDEPLPLYLFYLQRPLHLVIAPENMRDGGHPNRLYRDAHTNHISLGHLMARFEYVNP